MYKFFSLLIICGCSLQQAFAATPDINKVGSPKFPLKEGQVQIYLFKKSQLFAGKDWRYFIHDRGFDQADNKHYTVANVSSGKVLFGLKRGGYLATEPLYLDPKFIGKAIFIQVEDGSHRKLKYEFLDPKAAQLEFNKRYVVGMRGTYNDSGSYTKEVYSVKNLTIRNPPWKSMAWIEIDGQGNENGFLEGKGFIKLSDHRIEGEFKDGILIGEAKAYLGDKEFKGRLDGQFRPLEGTLYHKEYKTSYTGKFKNYWEEHGSGVCTDKNGIQKDCYFINGHDFTQDKLLESSYPLRKEVHTLIEKGEDILLNARTKWHTCNSIARELKFGSGDSWKARRAYDDIVEDFEEYDQDFKRLTNKVEDLIQKMKDNPQLIDEKGFDRLITDKYVGFATKEDSFYFYLNDCLKKGDRAVKDLNKIEARRKQREKEAAEYKAKIWAPSNFTALTNKDDPALRMLKQHQEAIRQAQEFNRKTQLTSSYSTQAALGTFGTTSTTSNKQNSVVTKNTELQSSKKENMQQNTQKSNASIKLPTSTYSQGKISQITLPNNDKQTVKSPTVPMEQFQEAIAYCAEFVSGGWKCNGPIQKIMVKVDTVEEGLKDVGCSTARLHVAYIPDGGDPKTQGAVYYCGYGLRNSDRNITKNMTIPTSLLNQRKNYQCPRSQLKRCETEL